MYFNKESSENGEGNKEILSPSSLPSLLHYPLGKRESFHLPAHLVKNRV
jgi:hypothetical protein